MQWVIRFFSKGWTADCQILVYHIRMKQRRCILLLILCIFINLETTKNLLRMIFRLVFLVPQFFADFSAIFCRFFKQLVLVAVSLMHFLESLGWDLVWQNLLGMDIWGQRYRNIRLHLMCERHFANPESVADSFCNAIFSS